MAELKEAPEKGFHEMKSDSRVARRSLFVKKDFQKRFIFKTLGLIFLLCVLFMALYLGSLLMMDSKSGAGNRLVEIVFKYSLAILRTRLGFILGIVAGVLFLFSLFLSHQIAGPIFRIETELERLSSGDLERPVRLREGDEFQEIADGINTLSDDFRELIRNSEALAEVVLERKCSQDSASYDELREKASRVREITGRYRIGSSEEHSS
ncbi:MAG: hypothetical protein CVV64_00560 [Candidatus Wallbacteria bacterium HGW-Wallbacteria-1]|jgi:methyl-accepting chemotaxis protein|uniref:HAMP domain-containing protein n=1 Tax=Candidatus Wallbacteria bacterium HGW-Wallbacteria-1 TaxID=2013854 RepID=A0A2N1PUC8_9BACT|nr:MAG: hypothetical protein CVV64_00560 [Candidatus Wallbacteria bacterium HGW-Wallbacteria-1]